ncbi:hypothetical protein [Goodfellowiella coeruleoviolacea]|uniref:hypothetical protein n=1 Tax=Goodfellowiella coeruleoviolacea TaxID=334858 RepID=UPI0020A28673|nr:hypothetical protein [Goodfellowiella coeruleoviolacea]
MTDAPPPDRQVSYDRRALVVAHLDAHPDKTHSWSGRYEAVLREHHQRLLDGLQRLFGFSLDREGWPADAAALAMLFRGTVDSCLALRTPGSGFLEGGLIIGKLENAGQRGEHVLTALHRIHDLTEQSRQAHLDILATLVDLAFGAPAQRVVTSADLRAIGVDDTPPPFLSEYFDDY